MPYCATFHRLLEEQNNRAIIDVNGHRQLLEQVFGDLGNISSEDVSLAELLKGKLVAGLRPQIEQCYALGPYSLTKDDNWLHGSYGMAVRRAKYHMDLDAELWMQAELIQFARRHPVLRNVDAVAATPRRDESEVKLGERLASTVATGLGVDLVRPRMVRPTEEQKGPPESASETEMIERIRGSMIVDDTLANKRVLIVDDVLGSGGTMREIGRTLRAAGASSVLGLSVAKDAKFTRGGVDLDAELWR